MPLPNTPPSGSPMGGGPPPGAMAGPPPGGPPPGGPPPGLPPVGAEGEGEGVTVEDLLAALKQLPPEMLNALVAELQAFLGPEGAEAGPPEMAGAAAPSGSGGPGGAGGTPPEMLREAAQARASMGP